MQFCRAARFNLANPATTAHSRVVNSCSRTPREFACLQVARLFGCPEQCKKPPGLGNLSSLRDRRQGAFLSAALARALAAGAGEVDKGQLPASMPSPSVLSACVRAGPSVIPSVELPDKHVVFRIFPLQAVG